MSGLLKHREKLLRETMKGEPAARADASDANRYARMLAGNRGLPNFERMTLHTRAYPGGRHQTYFMAATFGSEVCGEYEAGAFSLLFPGWDQASRPARVTMETLGDDGQVIGSQTLPAEPKKGGVIWSREDVRRAAGPVDKADRVKRAQVDHAPTVEMAPELPAEGMTPISAALGPAEAEIALSGPEIEPEAQIDPVTLLAERLAALEARVAALPVDTIQAPVADVAPAAVQPHRTAAHERAIRRAWAERKARRDTVAQLHIGQAQYDGIKAERDDMRNRLAIEQQAAGEAMLKAEQFAMRGNQHQEKRLRVAKWARNLVVRARIDREGQRHRYKLAQGQLAQLRADMADPSQPERASDIARLVRERDEARTALAAVNARNLALQSSVNDLADRFEGMVSRVTRAEAAMRKAGLAA